MEKLIKDEAFSTTKHQQVAVIDSPFRVSLVQTEIHRKENHNLICQTFLLLIRTIEEEEEEEPKRSSSLMK